MWLAMTNDYIAFGGSSSAKGDTGPFWIGSGLAVLSALVTFFFVKPLTHDGMKAEDEAVRVYIPLSRIYRTTIERFSSVNT